MATNNASNQNYANNSDGWQLSGGTTARKLAVTGADITLTGSGSNTYTFPASTDTLVGRASTDTLTNKTLTNPVISQINDANGNKILTLSATASAVNYLEIDNAATGGGLYAKAQGSDTDIDVRIQSKGNGSIYLQNTKTNGGLLQLTGVTTPANWLTISNSATGSGPTLQPTGSDSNIDINLVPQGTGKLKTTAQAIGIGGGSGVPSTPASGLAQIFGVGTSNLRPHWMNQSGTDEVIMTNGGTTGTTLGYAQITSNFTTTSNTPVQITGLSVTVTVPTGGRYVKITVFTLALATSTSNVAILTLWDGTVGSGTQLQQINSIPSSSFSSPATLVAFVAPTSGSHTYNVGLAENVSGTATFSAGVGAPGFIAVELA